MAELGPRGKGGERPAQEISCYLIYKYFIAIFIEIIYSIFQMLSCTSCTEIDRMQIPLFRREKRRIPLRMAGGSAACGVY
jgi:hypothetical protein